MIYNNKNEDVYIQAKNKIQQIIKMFWDFMEHQYSCSKINSENYVDMILIISEMFSILDDKSKWEERGYLACKDIKEVIEQSKINPLNLGMNGGLGYKCFCISRYHDVTGNLPGFAKSLNTFLLNQSSKIAYNLFANKLPTNVCFYDNITGIAGQLYYLLDFKWDNKEDIKMLKKLISYLIYLTKEFSYENHLISNFYISKNELYGKYERDMFQDGMFDFGMAHGMISTLVALTKAYNKGIEVEGIKDAISRIFYVYMKYQKYSEKIIVWPTKLSLKDYIKEEFDEKVSSKPSSWCYGSIGIVRGLQKSSIYMNDYKMEKFYKEELLNIINQSIENYKLKDICLCHGYSSVLSIRKSAYKDKGDKRFLENVDENINIIINRIENKTITTNHDDCDFSFLMGITGIILTLFSIICDNTEYDRLLMID